MENISKENNIIYETSQLDDILDALKKIENNDLQNSNLIEALKYFNKALELKPNYNECYRNKAKTYFVMGDFDNAIINYEIWEKNDKNAYNKINRDAMLNYALLLYYKNPTNNLTKQILEKIENYYLLMEISIKENNNYDVIKYSTLFTNKETSV